MTRTTLAFPLCALCFLAAAQTSDNPAMNAPDELAWKLFLQVNAGAGGSNALFETWASDTDTFRAAPEFPLSPSPMRLRPPVVVTQGRIAGQRNGRFMPLIPPDSISREESRRNKETFDFIVANNLYKVSGLKAAFGKEISFPIGAIEVKANWRPVGDIPEFTLNRVSLADVPKVFHVNTGADGKAYALVSMHIISKLVPNWTWATFENAMNPRRCDILGCIDRFGAVTSVVAPNAQAAKGYPDCTKSSALSAMISSAAWDPAFANYCLKGTQTDFLDNTGLANRLGNSITEGPFVGRSSCLTCHSRAAWDKNGKNLYGIGFLNGKAPLGPIDPAWFWSFTATPPIDQSTPGRTRIGTSADFVWSIPFCAYDDTVNPPLTPCKGQ